MIGAVLLASACSKPVASAAPPAQELGGEALFVSCAEVFKPGAIIDAKKAVTACHDLEGTARTPQYIRCTDGRHLFRIDAEISPNPGWGFTSSKFNVTADLETDPQLAAAMVQCRH